MPQEFKFIDLSYLGQMSGGNPQLMKEMITIFKKQVPDMIAAMKENAHGQNWEVLRKTFHKAKASAFIMGMTRTASELSLLETMTSDPLFQSEPIIRIQEIEKNFAGAIDELDRYTLFSQNS